MAPIQTPSSLRKRIRMRDVATRCNVSISTVSLVLSGDPRIPEDTRRRILQAVKAMGYRPSVIARNLARRASRTIGVILPEMAFSRNKAFYYQALQGIHGQTQPAGYKLVVEAANSVFLARRYYLRILREQSADGMIYLAANVQDGFLSELEKEHYPFILVGSSADGVNLLCAKGDDVEGAKLATHHLINLGHKAIAHLAGPASLSNGRDREKGYRAAMKEAGLAIDSRWVVQGDFDMDKAETLTRQLIQTGITAFFVGNDTMAYGALRALHEAGRRIPEDVAVVGMDDLEMSKWVHPPLTTVRYPIEKMAELAAQFIIRRIQNPLVQKSPLEPMPAPELVIRASCGGKR